MTSASVMALDNHGQAVRCRVLLDTCSTANFVTENFARRLKLPIQPCLLPIAAINEMGTISKGTVRITFHSLHNAYQKTLTFLTIPKIAGLIPSEVFPRELIKIPKNIPLADPEFHIPKSIDLLIGSGASLSLFSIGQIKLSRDNQDLLLQKTRLGWVIAGGMMNSDQRKGESCHLVDLHDEIERFWNIEEVGVEVSKSKEDIESEKHFIENVSRNQNGRYTVRLPFRNINKSGIDHLGDSYGMALKRFYALEKKFLTNLDLKVEYTKVMQEYIDLGHMSLAWGSRDDGYYMPHHAVSKESSATTKTRVVFDASAKTSSGASLNDLLMVGPTIQDKIFVQLIKFRIHKYVITADIEKMYRQINLHEEDKKYQRVLWRVDKDIKTFQLNTVTFGVSSSPFLAIRTIHKLADDEQNNFPKAAYVLKNDLYVDDLLTGTDNVDEARVLRDQIIAVLSQGGFNIRQWASNDNRILENLTDVNVNSHLLLDKSCTLKTLGISWKTQDDKLSYNVNSIGLNTKITKRNILSEIAKIFDPLGLLGPVILHAKMIMQRLWQCRVAWDESIPGDLHHDWSEFVTQLECIRNINIERRLTIDNTIDIQIHGFCDASNAGYGACLYIRSINSNNEISCQLICAKSRVSPLKTMTIPRLELCGAVLLTRLYHESLSAFKFNFSKIVFWSDSTIVLCWLKTSPNLLKTYVSNRVSEIQEKTAGIEWRHVRTDVNPADAVSRGQLPKTFIRNQQWFKGPAWLRGLEETWPNEVISVGKISELKKNVCLALNVGIDLNIFTKFSSYARLRRVIAYCLRFKHYKRKDRNIQNQVELLNVVEVNNAEIKILKAIQDHSFRQELKDISNSKSKGRLASLNPFIDNENGLLRVGGRLGKSNLSLSNKHPILLPSRHPVTDLIIEEIHERENHSAITATLYALRQKFWVTDGRNQVRRVIRKCVRCFRFATENVNYKMAELPQVRVTPAAAFSNTGVDFCGPFFVKEKKFRNRARVKVYVCVFVCMVIKAVHLEVVGELTTEGFLAAFRRFMSRRGTPKHVYSDNGTNFVGANNQLKELYALFNSKDHKDKINQWAVVRNLTWHFIPPLTPHFGGLWESTVKIFKHHLKRVVGELLFTLEEFWTLVIEIEGILNSRPLTPLFSDPNDILALSPSHYLIGEPRGELPETDLTSTPANRISSWQHISKVRQHFWARWSQEYLNELQQRRKWVKDGENLRVGMVVLVKNKTIPCLQWPLGKIIEVQPGSDGIVRTATVKTTTGEYQRSVKLLCPLPFNDET